MVLDGKMGWWVPHRPSNFRRFRDQNAARDDEML